MNLDNKELKNLIKVRYINISSNDAPKKSSINKNSLLNHVANFSFPRLAGTDGEKKAVKLTIKTFKTLGFPDKHIVVRDFQFSDFYSTTLVKLIMTINLIFNLVLMLLVYIHISLTMILIGVMVIVTYLLIRRLKHPEILGFWGEYFGDTLDATNVYVKIPAKKRSEKEAGNIILTAHLDSKSQTYTTSQRVTLYRLWVYSGIFFGLFYILHIVFLFGNLKIPILIALYGAWISSIIISLSNIFLLFLNTDNKSPGALDNASGMAIVFELSKFFLLNPLNNFNIWGCQFSAEELGTMGSRYFVNDHNHELIKGRVFQINFDMVSCNCQKQNYIQYFESYGILF
ncbi:MAG: M28 family peptidase, partial [Candidatus Thorarchaeota archaeon]